jgi:hypothetical protein
MPRTRRRSLPSACCLCFAGSALLVAPAQATEYGFSDYLLGYGIPMSGYTPPPGVYFSDTFYLYSASASPNITFPFGSLLAAGIKVDFITNIAATAWYTDVKILGGTLGFAAAVPVGSDTNTAGVSFIGASGLGRQLNRMDSVESIGDSAYSTSLGWEEGEHHWNVALTGFAPTGWYASNSLAFMGLNRPGFDIKGGYTFLSTQTGTEFSAAAGITFNLRNTASNYQSGDELHIEAALNQHFPFGLAVGVGGFFYQQITGDYGSGDHVGPFIGRDAGIGPLLSYTVKAGDQEVTFSGRWFHEFDVEHRFQGNLIFASFSFKL